MRKTATKTPPKAPESEVMAAALGLLRLAGVPHFRSNAGGGWRLGKGGRPQPIKGAPEGWPDITGWLPAADGRPDGRVMLLEIKRPGERPTPEQLAYLLRANADGGVGIWVDNVGTLRTALDYLMRGYRVVMEPGGDWDLAAPGGRA